MMGYQVIPHAEEGRGYLLKIPVLMEGYHVIIPYVDGGKGYLFIFHPLTAKHPIPACWVWEQVNVNRIGNPCPVEYADSICNPLKISLTLNCRNTLASPVRVSLATQKLTSVVKALVINSQGRYIHISCSMYG